MEVTIRKCPRCGAEWIQRIPNPLKCPRCFIVLEKIKKVGAASIQGATVPTSEATPAKPSKEPLII